MTGTLLSPYAHAQSDGDLRVPICGGGDVRLFNIETEDGNSTVPKETVTACHSMCVLMRKKLAPLKNA